MLRKIGIFLLGIIGFVSIVLNVYFFKTKSPSPLSSDKNLQNLKVTRVIDGDTFDAENGERYRLYEIDAPEYPKGCLGEDAKTRLENLILNKIISIKSFHRDNFGRILILVYSNNLFINEILVEEGYAVFSKDKTLTETSLTIEKAQEKARLTQRGVWSDLCLTKKDNCLIKGNYRSANNARIYHMPDCYNYDKITIKPGTSDRWFCSEQEAKMAGFRKSLDCPKL